jgi:hypothetical protein
MTAEFLWINVPLMVLAFGLCAGISLWLVLRHPDRNPSETRGVPEYLQFDWENLPTPSGRR